MKVLVVGPSPTKSKGGMATVIDEIKNDVKLRENFDIDIFDSYVDGGKLHTVVYSIGAIIKFAFTKKSYDIYHIHAASRGSTFRKGIYVDIAKHFGKNVVLHIHGAQYIEFYNEISDKKKKRVQDILKKADIVIALSQTWKEKFDTLFGLKNCVVLENGIDTDKLKAAQNEANQNKNSFAVLGRLGERKGTYDLLDAIENVVLKHPEVVFYLAGDGEIDKTRELVIQKKLEKNVKILGWISGKDKIDLLKSVTTVVLPSYNEGLPMAILEGMAAGKVIISTKVGAIPEVVDCDNGILIDAGNVGELSRAIIDVLEMPEQNLNSISKNNIEKIEKTFSMKVMHEKLGMIYKSQGESDDKLL